MVGVDGVDASLVRMSIVQAIVAVYVLNDLAARLVVDHTYNVARQRLSQFRDTMPPGPEWCLYVRLYRSLPLHREALPLVLICAGMVGDAYSPENEQCAP